MTMDDPMPCTVGAHATAPARAFIHRSLHNKHDPGLNFLLPLYHFLRNVCADAAYLLLIKGFRDSKYEAFLSSGAHSSYHSLYEFLLDVQRLGRNKSKKEQKSKGQVKEQTRRTTQIHNLNEHEEALKKVFIENLIQGDEVACKPLRDLDLSFMLNLIANDLIQYKINDSVLKAVTDIREMRNKLFHSKLNFNRDDFEKSLRDLVEATEVIHRHINPYGIADLHREAEKCKNQILEVKIGPQILEHLRSEIHEKYSAQPNYVNPVVVEMLNKHEHVIEDLPKYVREHSYFSLNKVPPILLCGAPGTGKSTLLQNLAFLLSRESQQGFQLVLYLDEWCRRCSSYHATVNTIKSSTEFWEQISKCVKSLAPNTVNMFGIESVKVVIKEYINGILFLVDWNSGSLGPLFKDMQYGTWVVAYQECVEPHSRDWQVLKIKPFSEQLVIQFLGKSGTKYQDDIVHLYTEWDNKDMLASPDMIKVFFELHSTVNFGTDFELIEAFINSKRASSNPSIDFESQLIKLGCVAFNGLKNGGKYIHKENELIQINEDVKHLFLMYREGRGTQFIHSVVQEFLAAKYAVHHPAEACKGWLLHPPFFMRAFKFACGMWCGDKSVVDNKLKFVEEYLTELFDITILKTKSKKYQEEEAMEVDEERKSPKNIKEKKQCIPDKPHKNPFTKWEYLIELDDVCQGHPKILSLFADLLSHIPFWTFRCNMMDKRKLRRIKVIVEKVRLKEDLPVTIKLSSSADVTMLIEIWNKLKSIKSLQKYAHIRIAVTHVKSFPFVEQDCLTSLCNTIVDAYCKVYLTSYQGPFLCSRTPEFLKCMCVQKIVCIDVTVYDIASLCEILKCDGLRYLQSISVTVDLKMDEQQLTELKDFSIPKHPLLMLRIKYFDNIQKLFDSAQSPHNLQSLSIYDVYVNDNFNLDLSTFTNLESLNIRCEPNEDKLVKNRLPLQQTTEHEAMDSNEQEDAMETEDVMCSSVSQMKRVPRESWMLPITVKLKPPEKLQRLLFRNMDFFNNSNNNLLLHVLNKYNVQKLMILDSYLTLKGVRMILCSHAKEDKDDIENLTKKLRLHRSASTDIRKLLCKRPRLSPEERERKRMEKPQGKEIIITSNVGICQSCFCFPCSCSGSENIEGKDTLEDLIYLIEDVYECNIVSFNYTSNIITVRKNVCEDLRIHCSLPELNDDTAQELCVLNASKDWLNRLFLTLTLAQSICLENTHLSFDGVKTVIDHLKTLKVRYSMERSAEPFSLLITSSYHPSDDSVVRFFTDYLRRENIFTTCDFLCSCRNQCYKIKKTHAGKIMYKDRVLDQNVGGEHSMS